MSEPTDYEVAALMQQLGGSFVARLAEAWMLGDPVNRVRIQQAFAQEWDDYRDVLKLKRLRQRAEATVGVDDSSET